MEGNVKLVLNGHCTVYMLNKEMICDVQFDLVHNAIV